MRSSSRRRQQEERPEFMLYLGAPSLKLFFRSCLRGCVNPLFFRSAKPHPRRSLSFAPPSGPYVADGSNVISIATDGAFSVFGIDLDGDGDVDVLSASRTDGTVAWYICLCERFRPST